MYQFCASTENAIDERDGRKQIRELSFFCSRFIYIDLKPSDRGNIFSTTTSFYPPKTHISTLSVSKAEIQLKLIFQIISQMDSIVFISFVHFFHSNIKFCNVLRKIAHVTTLSTFAQNNDERTFQQQNIFFPFFVVVIFQTNTY